VSEVSLSSELYLAPEMMYVSLGRLSNPLNNFLQIYFLIMCSSECIYQCVYAALVGLIKVLPIRTVVRIRDVAPGSIFTIHPGSRIQDTGFNNYSKRRGKLRGVLGNKCAGQHNLKTVDFREILASGNFLARFSAVCVFFCSALSTLGRQRRVFM
jgi:hypothetical protein